MMQKELFSQFILESNLDGSNKAKSYLRAIELLSIVFSKHSHLQERYGDVWSITDVTLIDELYSFVLEQQKLYRNGSGLFLGETPKSYWEKGFCSAAVKSYKEFLILNGHENKLWTIYQNPNNSPVELSTLLDKEEISYIKELVSDVDVDFSTKEGKEVLRSVKTRVGQGFFRKMIMNSYNTQCCITGLNIPEVLRASHIVAWADDEKNRLNPANGLCLSATYDAAFDRHLISFDDNFRMILSSDLKEHFTNEAFKETFLRYEGCSLTLPNRFLPDKTLLEKHRKKMIS